MRATVAKQIQSFLQSTEATASAFSSIGWDTQRDHGDRAFLCVVDYGILEEMELTIVAHKENDWFAELYVPPILSRYEKAARALCDELSARFPPLVAVVDVDLAVILGVAGEGDPTALLSSLWRCFAEDDVYQTVLLLSGMSAPTEDDVAPYELPDDPFDE